jgi:outer membrane protein assembly factor BamD (BamD/ComL family)
MSQVKCRYLALKALMLTALFSVSAQASPDRDAWISASLLGTTEAYESFLEHFPDSKYAEQALESLADSFDTAAGGDVGGGGAAGAGEGESEGGQY